ncbi:hypothetical protein ASPZODRAFT_143961 [Penicilliopsis zonata CBS 506.65]|uniref:NAD-dependent epimerase/dehydratase domain-containing protein n=1 Tax=Penicilliopsis zonata CBS 506.65 TaxID=1073090 RepID=A0A1L9SDM8_9EURO|nr:hypothetical protein ASPZODRAFT_143961 [Penicilliopsis zonata CBS 506.65]OJJ45320.1 hypothetical protein ASPZODRAFT_143961 [Penicilliopsis zonata CBS 506.65]
MAIFITGATGFIGAATALEAVKTGYRVRLAIRRESQIEKLQHLLAAYADRVEFVVVPDITAEDAYAGKLDGVEYVIHIASPLLPSIDKKISFQPAVEGTLSILNEAVRVSSVKKVVITSSVSALVPFAGVPRGGIVTEEPAWDLSVDTDADFTGPNDTITSFLLYRVSKMLANDATWDFHRRHSPPFSLVVIYPTFVYGHDILQTGADGGKIGITNGMLLDALRTGQPWHEFTYVHIRDVVSAHLRALDAAIPDGSKYILAGRRTSWREIARYLKENYDGVVKFGLSEDNELAKEFLDKSLPTDASKAERELGIRWTLAEEVIREVVEQNLALLKTADRHSQ